MQEITEPTVYLAHHEIGIIITILGTYFNKETLPYTFNYIKSKYLNCKENIFSKLNYKTIENKLE